MSLPVLAHASLGASSAARWMACPGSPNLIDSMPGEEGSGSTFASREGSCAHEVAHLCFLTDKSARDYIGHTAFGVTADEEMAEHVQVYVDHVSRPRGAMTLHWYEQKFSLAALNPPVPMFGTADHVAYERVNRTLDVDDLKYGQGVMVEIEGNPQPKYYALGAILSMDLKTHPVEWVNVTIVQPRKEHEDGYVRTQRLSIDEVMAFGTELLEAAHKTLDPAAPLVPGDHCRWCRARPVCPALRQQTQEIAAIEFDADGQVVPPAPATLTMPQLVMVLEKLPMLDDWSKAVKAYAEDILRAGGEVPGFKMVERRARRDWNDTASAYHLLIQVLPNLGIAERSIMEKPKLRSPAQIEKFFKGKKKFETIMGSLVAKKSSGLKMVPESDRSPAVSLTAGSEFDALPAADSETNAGKERTDNE